MTLTPDDFPQFDDPRVREVMAAAARVVEWYEEQFPYSNLVGRVWIEGLKTALFAAQRSKPRAHEKPIPADEWGFQHPETNQFIVVGSKPGGKAFIEAVEAPGQSPFVFGDLDRDFSGDPPEATQNSKPKDDDRHKNPMILGTCTCLFNRGVVERICDACKDHVARFG